MQSDRSLTGRFIYVQYLSLSALPLSLPSLPSRASLTSLASMASFSSDRFRSFWAHPFQSVVCVQSTELESQPDLWHALLTRIGGCQGSGGLTRGGRVSGVGRFELHTGISSSRHSADELLSEVEVLSLEEPLGNPTPDDHYAVRAEVAIECCAQQSVVGAATKVQRDDNEVFPIDRRGIPPRLSVSPGLSVDQLTIMILTLSSLYGIDLGSRTSPSMLLIVEAHHPAERPLHAVFVLGDSLLWTSRLVCSGSPLE